MNFFPILFILIGFFWLLKNLNFLPPNTGDIFWPLIVIALGISMLIKKKMWWGIDDRSKKQDSVKSKKDL